MGCQETPFSWNWENYMRLEVRTIASIGLMLAIAGCKMHMEADMYSSDIRLASEGENGMTTPATLFLPITSENECVEQTEKISAMLLGLVDTFQPKGCESQGMESYMLANMQLPVINSTAAWEEAESLFGFIARQPEGSEAIDVLIVMNTETYETLQDRVRAEYFQELDLGESTFTVVVNNDERADMAVLVENAFANGIPVLDTEYTVPRRGQITVRLSDVSVNFLGKNGYASAFGLTANGVDNEHSPERISERQLTVHSVNSGIGSLQSGNQ